ncbi:MAG TPA: alpha/beta fold hydrolase [Pseudomonadales bacterium]|nr:alpha/beta fold hydrolase [Pseudomonadales bacterium]
MKFSENRFAVCRKPVLNPKKRLFCFPSAGAGAAQFVKWHERVPADVEVWSIQLPGREHLFQAAKPDDVVTLAGLIRRDIRPLFNLPYFFYGHSYGSVVSYEVVNQEEKGGGRLPDALLVGARRAPHLGYEEVISQYSDEKLVAALDQFGGLPEIIKADAEMLSFYLNTIRYDLKLNERYVVGENHSISVPIAAFYGSDDDYVKPDQVYAWRKNTKKKFDAHLVQGGHFFMADADAEFFSLLKKMLGKDSADEADDLIAY